MTDSRSYVERLREGIGPTGTVNRAYRIWTTTQLVNNAAAMLSELIEAAYDYYSDHRDELRKTAPNEV